MMYYHLGMNKKTTRKVCTYSGMHVQMIEDIVEHKGFFTEAEALRAIVVHYHTNEVAPLMKANPGVRGRPRTKMTERERVADIATRLQAEIVTEKGVEYAVYTQYQEEAGKVVRTAQKRVPLATLEESDIDLQYIDLFGGTGPNARKRIEEIHAA